MPNPCQLHYTLSHLILRQTRQVLRLTHFGRWGTAEGTWALKRLDNLPHPSNVTLSSVRITIAYELDLPVCWAHFSATLSPRLFSSLPITSKSPALTCFQTPPPQDSPGSTSSFVLLGTLAEYPMCSEPEFLHQIN